MSQSLPPHPDVVIDSSQRVWSGRFPLDVVKFRNRRFDGAMSAARTWELWRRGRAAAALPYDPWTDQVVLIEQFRLPALAAGLDPVLVELPAGLCDGEEAADTAITREMREEMGLAPDRLESIGRFLLSAGATDENCALFAARVRAPGSDAAGLAGYGGLVAENEDIRVRVWPTDRAIEAAFAGRFTNMITATALFWLAAQRERLRRDWRAI